MAFDLTSYKGMFFDIYGTCIDWETGIYPYLLRLSQKLPIEDPRRGESPENRRLLLKSYAEHEGFVEHENPTLEYPKILEAVYDRIVEQLGVQGDESERVAFGRSIGEWGPFSDTVEALKALSKHYKLFVLSNVDDASFARTLAGPLKGVNWDGIYTAEQIGSYKPSANNYNFVVEKAKKFGIEKDQLLLVAQSLDVDHVAVKKLGFRPSVWISRYAGNAGMGGRREDFEAKGEINLGAAYNSLGELAEAVGKAYA